VVRLPTTGFGAKLLGGGSAGDTNWNSAVYANDGGSGAGGKSIPDEWSRRGGRPIVGGSRKGGLLQSATLYEGFRGGFGVVQNNNGVSSGGGGGAGAVGGDGNTSTGSIVTVNVGGDGVSNTILDTTYWWGGGGAGGCHVGTPSNGGKGGGGAGYNNPTYGGTGTYGANGGNSWQPAPTGASITNGTPSSGGGGGGSPYQIFTAGSGGSGIIILRYRLPIPGISQYKSGMIGDDYKIQSIQSTTIRDRFIVEIHSGDCIVSELGPQ
jgi:hypothetical protein